MWCANRKMAMATKSRCRSVSVVTSVMEGNAKLRVEIRRRVYFSTCAKPRFRDPVLGPHVCYWLVNPTGKSPLLSLIFSPGTWGITIPTNSEACEG